MGMCRHGGKAGRHAGMGAGRHFNRLVVWLIAKMDWRQVSEKCWELLRWD